MMPYGNVELILRSSGSWMLEDSLCDIEGHYIEILQLH